MMNVLDGVCYLSFFHFFFPPVQSSSLFPPFLEVPCFPVLSGVLLQISFIRSGTSLFFMGFYWVMVGGGGCFSGALHLHPFGSLMLLPGCCWTKEPPSAGLKDGMAGGLQEGIGE